MILNELCNSIINIAIPAFKIRSAQRERFTIALQISHMLIQYRKNNPIY
jgi:hypothetical protein